MKFLLLILCLFLLNNFLLAQNTSARMKAPVSRITNRKIITVQQSVSHQINNTIDSLIRNNSGKGFYTITVISSIETVLYSYWKNGLLLGVKSSQAYFVQCGNQTMTQSNTDKGFLIVSVGIACSKPAEFELLRFERMIPEMKIIISN